MGVSSYTNDNNEFNCLLRADTGLNISYALSQLFNSIHSNPKSSFTVLKNYGLGIS